MSEHYFTADPASAAAFRELVVRIAGDGYRFTTAAGTFSTDRLDLGTSVLLERGPQPSGSRLLDLGCGWGPIAVSLARRVPAATVWAVDANRRALQLTARNAAAAGVSERVRTAEPDEVGSDLAFDQIWSNPPIRVGKSELHAILVRWLPRLSPQGTAWLVVARHLGADSLADWLTGSGFPTQRHASAKGFRVLRVSRAPDQGADGPLVTTPEP